MSSALGKPPSLDELIAKVRDVATTLAIRLPYNPQSPPPTDAVNQVKAEILAELKRREKHGAYVIPSRDGLLVVIPSEDEHEKADEFVDLVTAAVQRSPAANQFCVDDMSVNAFPSAPTIVRTVAIDKRKFYAAPPAERYSMLLERVEAIPAEDLLERPVRSTGDCTRVGVAFEYRGEIERGPQPLDYRDPYFQDNPNTAASELRLLRHAAERLAEEFGTEAIQQKFVAANLANVIDRRYWPSYAMEYRNIPAFLREHMTIEIQRLPRGTPGGRIQEIVHRHREFFDKISVRIPAELDFVATLTPFPSFREVAIVVGAEGSPKLDIIAICAQRLHRAGFDVRLVNVPDHLLSAAHQIPFVKLFS